MAAFPEMPPELREFFPPAFWHWWEAFRSFVLSDFATQGDIEIFTAGTGVVLKTPNGNRWRVTVDNAGALITTAL